SNRGKQHEGVAEQMRKTLVAKFGPEGRGLLPHTGPQFDEAVKLVNDAYKTKLDPAVIVPSPDGIFQIEASKETGDRVVLLLGYEGNAHFEAVAKVEDVQASQAKATTGTSNPATGSQGPKASSEQPLPSPQIVTPSIPMTGHDDDALNAARNWDYEKLRSYMEKQTPDVQPMRATHLMHVMLDSLDKNMTSVGIASIGKLKACTLLLLHYGGDPSSADRLVELATEGSRLPDMGHDDLQAWVDCIEFAERLGK
ncbi:MAG: hypothetical protein ABIR26_13775, partial [Ramlibacter sp.]